MQQSQKRQRHQKASFHVEGGGPRKRWRIENSVAHESTLHVCSHLWHCTANQLHAYVAVLCQSARLAGYHPPLMWSPLFQGKRALLRCSIVPISRTRRLSPTAGAVPPLSEKEGFPSLHHPLPFFMSNSLRGCTNPSLLPCGRRGTACGGG